MKVTLKKITVTTIISFTVYVSLMLVLFSCRTVKKEWVKENFTEKSELQEIKESLNYSNELIKEDIRQTILAEFKNNLIEITSKLNETLEENTIAKIDIEAEFGKIKEATIGSTKVTSNGAKISVETNTSKYLQKDYESYKKETQETIEMLLSENVLLEKKIDKYSAENNNLKTELTKIKETQSRYVTKKQLGLGFVLLIVIGLIIYFINKSFRFL